MWKPIFVCEDPKDGFSRHASAKRQFFSDFKENGRKINRFYGPNREKDEI